MSDNYSHDFLDSSVADYSNNTSFASDISSSVDASSSIDTSSF